MLKLNNVAPHIVDAIKTRTEQDYLAGTRLARWVEKHELSHMIATEGGEYAGDRLRVLQRAEVALARLLSDA